MAFHLLERDRHGAQKLSELLGRAMAEIGHCRRCRTYTELEICPICASARRTASGQLCIVETPADVAAFEASGSFSGRYFVLMGHLSPLDGIGPEDIGLDTLEQQFAEDELSEVILATNPTVEGEATAHYIAELAAMHGIRCSRIAHGVPVGGELEYVDSNTLARSLAGRQPL